MKTACFILVSVAAALLCCSNGSEAKDNPGAKPSGYVYLCDKCKTTCVKKNQPATPGCPASGYHHWNNLGHAGSTPYLCRKCQIKVYVKDRPSTVRCPASGYHQWNKL